MEPFDAVRLESAGLRGHWLFRRGIVARLYSLQSEAAANLNIWSSFVFRHIFGSRTAQRRRPKIAIVNCPALTSVHGTTSSVHVHILHTSSMEAKHLSRWVDQKVDIASLQGGQILSVDAFGRHYHRRVATGVSHIASAGAAHYGGAGDAAGARCAAAAA